MALIVKVRKKTSKPCQDCGFKTTGRCQRTKRCKEYLAVTPSCNSCIVRPCKDRGRVAFCKRWEPDKTSPFLALMSELSALRESRTDKAVSLLDDRDFKQAPNFITFCLDYLQVHPFPKQIECGSLLFGDICFKCSNPAYRNLYDETLGEILDNIVFLEFGICPKCGRNRFELMKLFPSLMAWYQELIGVAGQRSGKCLTENVLIPSNKGLVPIKYFSNGNHKTDSWIDLENVEVYSYKGDKVPATKLYKGKEKTLKATTRHGFEIEGRYEHPILVLTPEFKIKWKRLKDIEAGDYACIDRRTKLHPGNEDSLTKFTWEHRNLKQAPKIYELPTKMNEEFATILGYLVAEGKDFGISSGDREVIKLYTECCKKCFPDVELRYGLKTNKGNRAKITYEEVFQKIGTYSVGFHSKFINTFLEWCGYYSGSGNKEIPWCILQARSQYVSAFLRAYFDGDGGVGKGTTGGVGASTKSEKLSKQLQTILLGFGIVSYRRSFWKSATNGTVLDKDGKPVKRKYWSISIRKEYVKKFYQKVGFNLKRKQDRLKKKLKANKYYELSYNDRVPYLSERLRKFRKEHMSNAAGKFIIDGEYVTIPTKVRSSNYCGGKNARSLTVPGVKYKELKNKFQGNKLKNISKLDPDLAKTIRFIGKRKYFFSEITITEKTGVKDVYDFHVPKYHSFIGNGFVNHNSELASQIASYVWHWYTKIGDSPSKFYGLLNKRLHMTFTALTFGQAKKNLWDPFYDYLKGSSWFTDLHKAMNSRCAELGIEPVIKFQDTFIFYKHKNLECAPAGPDKRVLRGPTRILMAIDELGWFTGSKSAIKINPDEVYNALSNSLTTIRGQHEYLRKLKGLFHIPSAYAINISSPSSARDKIMRLLYQSRKIKNIFSFHLPTWEMNPNLPRSHSLFETEFQKNPKDANRDFGAFPPLTENPFISEIGPIRDIAVKKKNIFDYRLVMIRSKSGKQYVSLRLDKIIPRNRPLLIGVDAGRSGNAFAIVATSYNKHGQVILEGAIEVKPLPNLPVNFPDVYKHGLLPILKTQTVPALLVDQWQSIDLVDKVDEDFGDKTDAVRYSLKYGDFEDARQRLLGEQVVLPEPEIKSWKSILKGIEDYEEFFVGRPLSHLYLQLATVQDSGRRVEKSGDLDDDLFRALMLCVHFTFDEKDGYKYELMSDADAIPYGTETLGIVRGLSMGERVPSTKRLRTTLSQTSMGLSVGLSGKVVNTNKLKNSKLRGAG